jgi:hypothetical protein
MSKATSILFAAIAALSLFGCNTSGPANNAASGYGNPGATGTDSGAASATSAPKSNNSLATPSVVSPAAGQ